MTLTQSAEARICPDCRQTIPIGAREGLCPRCLARLVLGGSSQSVSAEQLAAQRFFGDYELLDELGRGGSGLVFKARQLGVNRIVALKLLAGGPAAGRDFVHRVHTEAAAAAQLEHPNIVPIYEFGEHEGAHYLTMRYLDGGTLQDRTARTRVPALEAARLLIPIANAVDHAHKRGILHRDLKPANVLLDAAGTPYVSDFGLARVAEQESSLTVSHTVLGTVAYLAPEVALGGARAATTASDVYGLGSILYELLTGKPPFAAQTAVATMRLVAEADPPDPRTYNPDLPSDLVTICLKCLEKNPAQRFESAQALADDLTRFLNHEPIAARSASRVEKLVRWCQRKPALAISYSLLLLTVIAILVASPVAIYRINEARKAESALRSFAETTAKSETEIRQYLEAQNYAADMNLVLQAWEEGKFQRAQSILNKHIPAPGQRDLRGFEWRYLTNLCQDESIFSFHFPASVGMVLSKDGSYLAAHSEAKITLLDYLNRRELASLIVADTNHITALGFSSNTNILAAAYGRTIRLWDIHQRTISRAFDALYPAIHLSFSPDGGLLAVSGGHDQTIELWRLHDRTRVWSRRAHSAVYATVFTPDGGSLVSGGSSTSGPLFWNVSGDLQSIVPNEHNGRINSIGFSPNEQRIATVATDSTVVFWDAKSRAALKKLFVPGAGAVAGFAFSSDGAFLTVGSADSTVRLIDCERGLETALLRGHRGGIRNVAFSPDGRLILSSSFDRTIKLWNTASRAKEQVLTHDHTWASTADFSPDGRRLITTGVSLQKLALWDIATRQRIAELPKGNTNVGPGALFSPDGSLIAHLADDRIRLWDAKTLTIRSELTNGFDGYFLSFSPDSRILVAAGMALFRDYGVTNRLAFWDVNSGQKIQRLAAAAPLAQAAIFSHSGQLLATGHMDGAVRLWNFTTDQPLAEFTQLRRRIWALAFSPDDEWLVAGNEEGTILWCHVPTRQAFQAPAASSNWTLGLAFSPDGKSLASAEGDGVVNLWNVATRQRALMLKGHQAAVSKASFSPDGRLLATCAGDGSVRLWPIQPTEPR